MAPLHPFPAPSIPPSPTLPILLPPLTLLCILLLLYIRRPPAIVPTRPMATVKTPLLSGTTRARTRVRGHRRISTYGGIQVTVVEGEGECACGEEGCEGGKRGRGVGKRPRLVRRDEEDVDVLPASGPQNDGVEARMDSTNKARTNSVPTLAEQEGESSDEQGPSTPDEGTGMMLFRDSVGKVGAGKGVNVLETEVLETPVEERGQAGGMSVPVVCV